MGLRREDGVITDEPDRNEPEITDATLDQVEEELKAQRKIMETLRKVDDPVKRHRVLRAVIALYGYDVRGL